MSLDNIIKYFEKFDFSKLHKVPEGPGVYCWYGTKKLTKPDWQSNYEDFEGYLIDSCHQYRPGRLKATLESQFGLRWNEDLKEVSTMTTKFDLKQFHLDEELRVDEDVDLKATDTQRLIAEALNLCEPIFSAPIYIGHSRNLRNRVDQHKNELSDLEDSHCDPDDYADSKGKSFAERCFGARFSPTNLSVYVLSLEKLCSELDISAPSTAELKKISCYIEHLLNRKYRPLLGKI